jgi:hypothetical protein
MYQWPHLPRSLTGSQKIILDLVPNNIQRVSIHKTKIGEEHGHEDGTPNYLIDGNLAKDWDGIGSGDLFVEPVVEVMAGGAVVDESEEGEGGETFPVYWASSDEDLLGERKFVRVECTREPCYVYHNMDYSLDSRYLTCASKSPRNQPAREVKALVVMGFLSKASE